MMIHMMHDQEDGTMPNTAQTVSLEEFIQHADAYFTRAASGDLIRIVHEDQETYLIGSDHFHAITDYLCRHITPAQSPER